VTATAEPVRRTHFVPAARPAEAYAVVVDFASYPRLFPEITAVRVLEVDGRRHRVEFKAKVVLPVRYVLDLVCDAQALTVDWTYVEGEVVTSSVGRWRFKEEGGGTWLEYEVALDIKAPLPGFVLRKVTDGLVSLSLPAMFSAIAREIGARRSVASP
jgi:ribosome-associated toxin RatA of RatAB toxin-antitoxin module